MSDFKLTTPVAFFTFNRLDSAQQVFERIRQAKPERLYLVSDGPRSNKEGEDKKVEEVRDYILSNIDWDCEVFKNFATANMGCGRRMASGISWVFEHEERAMFFEDDCVPDPSFFRYAQELLEKYADNDEVMLISGNNQIAYLDTIPGDYGFSHQANIWGWASWRSTWKDYDFDIKSWPENRKNPVWKEIYNRKARWTLLAEFDHVCNKAYDIWDYQFSYQIGLRKGYCIIPKYNLVSNVGFTNAEYTHTSSMPEWMDQSSRSMTFPINHPDKVEWTRKYDEEFSNRDFKAYRIVHIKHLLGLNVNKSVFEIFKKK